MLSKFFKRKKYDNLEISRKVDIPYIGEVEINVKGEEAEVKLEIIDFLLDLTL